VEILIRLVDGKLAIQTTAGDNLAVVGVLRLAEHQILSRLANPQPAVQVPNPALASALLGRG
jgi:hypothetical protein